MASSRSENTVALDSHALGTLKYIRASIDAASQFAVPGIAGLAMGALGMVATVTASLPGLGGYWLQIWVAAAIAACAIGVVLIARHPVKGSILYRGPARKFVLSLCPSLLAGVIFTVVLWQSAHSALIPGTWLVLYGCAVLSASMMTRVEMMRLVALMGALFVAYGVVAFALPEDWHNFVLGFGFGALHLVFGILIGRVERGG